MPGITGEKKMTGRICGTGSYIPPRTIDNNELSTMVETNDEWIRERTGVARRHIIEDDTTVTMAVRAAESALRDAGTDAGELDLIIVSTLSANCLCPSTACEVQKSLGAVRATCFDMNAACTGFLFAYHTAQAYICSGMYRNILIIGAESLSNLVNWSDRSTCILFGDGAGAAVVKAEDNPLLFESVTHSDGFKGDALLCESRNQKKFEQGNAAETYVRMNGQDVFKFAVKRVPEVIRETLDKAGQPIEEVDYFVLHQANRRIVEAVARRLKTDMRRFPMNLEEYGNTSSASIPILLDELNKKGVLKRGSKIMMAGFGAGLSWGAALLEW